uniref:Methyltransferase domain-containing protein n=1 Tax=Haptolina ericina TaxID=156174 RepID=A0A7S3FIW3_9EUKA|mmetsp:Transcript_72727/g.161630  ORF Transcript_72727/g.161630 Transcript_72727/m.161630 type:complete len:161 (+) Transcript_72727:1-483(+)
MAAAAAGAVSCQGVDSSAAAVCLAQANVELNGFATTCSFTKSDVVNFLRDQDLAGTFDVVICDPPKLAPSVKDLPRATRKYRQINSLAMRAVRPGGLLLSCTCSGAMTQSGRFVAMLHESAVAAGRTLTVLRTSGAACDHVLHPCCPESNYLTAVLLQVS